MSRTKYPGYISRKVAKWLDARAENPKIGRVNAYHCPACEKALFTRDVDVGVTPMMLRCLECGGLMTSAFYRVDQDESLATSEFYRPDDAEFALLDAGTREHCREGGLLMRERKT